MSKTNFTNTYDKELWNATDDVLRYRLNTGESHVGPFIRAELSQLASDARVRVHYCCASESDADMRPLLYPLTAWSWCRLSLRVI
jgi:hypothetical protein